MLFDSNFGVCQSYGGVKLVSIKGFFVLYETFLSVYHPIQRAWVLDRLVVDAFGNCFLSELPLANSRGFPIVHIHDLSHHICSRASCFRCFLVAVGIAAEDFIEVLHEANEDVVERACVHEVRWAELFWSEYVWADGYRDVVVRHLIMFFLFNYGHAEGHDVF